MTKRNIERFLANNFPAYDTYNIKVNQTNSATIVLDYGKNQPLLEVDIVQSGDTYDVYKLADTRFIE